MHISSMILENQTLEANIPVFIFFGKTASNCLQVIAVTWGVVEKD